MTDSDYTKQLEETNRQLQEKLEASEKKHDDFLDKRIYIYMDGKSRSFDNLSFTDKNGVFEGEMRVVTSMRYIEKDERMYGEEGSECYEETWASDGRGGYKWVVTPSLNNINVNMVSAAISAKTRKFKVVWTAESVDDFKNIGNLGDVDLTSIEQELQKEVEKFYQANQEADC